MDGRTSCLKALKLSLFDPYCVKAPIRSDIGGIAYFKPWLYESHCPIHISINQDNFLSLC